MKTNKVVKSILFFSMAACFVTFHCNGPTTPFNNGLPVCSDVALQTTDAVPVNVDIQASDPDGDYIGWKIIQHPVLGSVNKTGGSVGAGYEFMYTSRNILADSVETLVVAVSDWMDTLRYKQINVIIAITALDNQPIALDCTTDVYRNAGLLDIPGFDPEGQPVRWEIITQPAHGSIVRLKDTITDSLEAFYISNSGSAVDDFFTFRVLQDTNQSNSATYTLKMKNAYLLQQGVPFNGNNYAGCEDTYLSATFAHDMIEMVKDTLTNYSGGEDLYLNFCT